LDTSREGPATPSLLHLKIPKDSAVLFFSSFVFMIDHSIFFARIACGNAYAHSHLEKPVRANRVAPELIASQSHRLLRRQVTCQ
jgi:hypothetical protein